MCVYIYIYVDMHIYIHSGYNPRFLHGVNVNVYIYAYGLTRAAVDQRDGPCHAGQRPLGPLRRLMFGSQPSL